MEGENGEIRNRLNSSEGEVNLLRGKVGDVGVLERAVKELERECKEKGGVVETLRESLSVAQKKVDELSTECQKHKA